MYEGWRRHDQGEQPGCTRRTALKVCGAALAGGLLPLRAAYAVDTAPRAVRIGVVGGGFGCAFQWHEHPDCVVAAVSDLREDRRTLLAKTYGCNTVYDSLAELVKDPGLDAVAVFTDGDLHVSHAIEAMAHGKHVIAAVPACYATVDEAEQLLEAQQRTGMTYMMAETSYYQQFTISARKFQQEGRFGEIFYCESEYQHDDISRLYWTDGKPNWRYGFAPMYYPTHCTAHLISVTGERLTEVTCTGWGDDDPILKDNTHKNPFWNESALFRTDRGHAFRANVWWKGAHRACERAEWIGNKMSFYARTPHGAKPMIVRSSEALRQEQNDGAEHVSPPIEVYEQEYWWKTDLLPEPLRHDTGHHGSHGFLTHEFIDALTNGRRPIIDIYEALAYTVPGLVAHQSALQGGVQMKIPQFDRPAA